MHAVGRLLLVAWFAAAQSVVWTDCGEGLLCPDKAGCSTDDCCPREDAVCAHLEPQGDVDRPAPDVDADAVAPVALLDAVAPLPAAAPAAVRPDVPPRLRPRPLLEQLSVLLV
jgi:hypothetical protein